jgi:hypothetical protein
VSYRIEEVRSSRTQDFAEAYAALAAEFGPRGELERREVIAGWLESARADEGALSETALRRTYHLLVARDGEGKLAGVRDCHVVLDRSGVAVVYLAHALVLAPYRRTGLGALFRRVPIEIGQRAIGESRMDLLLAAEMEPASFASAPTGRTASPPSHRRRSRTSSPTSAISTRSMSTAKSRDRFLSSPSSASSVTKAHRPCRRGSPERSSRTSTRCSPRMSVAITSHRSRGRRFACSTRSRKRMFRCFLFR